MVQGPDRRSPGQMKRGYDMDDRQVSESSDSEANDENDEDSESDSEIDADADTEKVRETYDKLGNLTEPLKPC